MSIDTLLFLMEEYKMERGSITSKEASDFLAIQDLPKRISDLINYFGYGSLIKKEKVNSRNRFRQACQFTRYSMEVQHGGVYQTS